MPFCQPIGAKLFLYGGRASPGKAATSILFLTAGVTPTPELQGRIHLGCMERSSLHSIGIAGESAEASRAVKKDNCWQPASPLTEYDPETEQQHRVRLRLHRNLE